MISRLALRESRVKSGLTQGELADKLGVHKQTVWQWETGRRTPDEQSSQKIIQWATSTLGQKYVNKLTDDKVDPVRTNENLDSVLVMRRRKELGLSQKELATKAGVDHSYIVLIERDGYCPRPDKVDRIAEALGMDLGDLLPAGFNFETIPTRPVNADLASLQRTAPMPPSKTKHARQAKAALLAARDRLASALNGMEEKLVHQTLKDVLAAVDELDKLMEQG